MPILYVNPAGGRRRKSTKGRKRRKTKTKGIRRGGKMLYGAAAAAVRKSRGKKKRKSSSKRRARRTSRKTSRARRGGRKSSRRKSRRTTTVSVRVAVRNPAKGRKAGRKAGRRMRRNPGIPGTEGVTTMSIGEFAGEPARNRKNRRQTYMGVAVSGPMRPSGHWHAGKAAQKKGQHGVKRRKKRKSSGTQYVSRPRSTTRRAAARRRSSGRRTTRRLYARRRGGGASRRLSPRRRISVPTVRRAGHTIRRARRGYGGRPAQRVARSLRLNPAGGMIGTVWMTVRVAMPVALSLYLSRVVANQIGSRVPQFGRLGRAAAPTIAAVTVVGAHFATMSGPLRDYRTGVMLGTGINFVDTLVSAFAPSNVSAMFGLASSQEQTAPAGYLSNEDDDGLSDYDYESADELSGFDDDESSGALYSGVFARA